MMIAAVLGAIALKKAHHEPAADAAATASAGRARRPRGDRGAAATPPHAAALPTMTPRRRSRSRRPLAAAAPPADPVAANDDSADEPSTRREHHKHGKVTPFGNGPVHHGNVLHLKMDGPIEAIEGAQQPTGFAVKIPGRKSLEAAGPLAARDSRIAAIKVSNDGAGAELTVAFKDGVPNYQVARQGRHARHRARPRRPLDKTVAARTTRATTSGKHHKTDKSAHKKQRTERRALATCAPRPLARRRARTVRLVATRSQPSRSPRARRVRPRRRSSPRCRCSSRAAARGRAGRVRAASSRHAPPELAVRRDAASEHHVAHPLALRGLDELAREHARHGRLERRAHVGHPRLVACAFAPRDEPRDLRLDAREAHLERAARRPSAARASRATRRPCAASRSTTGPPG